MTKKVKVPNSISAWLEAECTAFHRSPEPQPKGSITVEQYAEATGKSVSRARTILCKLRSNGLATCVPWKNSSTGVCKAYFLKPKKEWPRATSK